MTTTKNSILNKNAQSLICHITKAIRDAQVSREQRGFVANYSSSVRMNKRKGRHIKLPRFTYSGNRCLASGERSRKKDKMNSLKVPVESAMVVDK